MSKGACIIASNSGKMDYIGLAEINASLIRKHLDLPVCLVTTDLDSHSGFDSVIRVQDRPANMRSLRINGDTYSYDWKNDYRISIYDITPYDRTLVLDADYLIMSDTLDAFVACDQEFMIVDTVYDISGNDSFRHDDYLPDLSMRQRWATVLIFERSSKTIFDAAAMVRENYAYYAAMFHLPNRPFRNDYAFTIACHLLNVPSMPYTMCQTPFEADVQADERGFKISYGSSVLRWNSDLHVLNKEIVMNPKTMEPLLYAGI